MRKFVINVCIFSIIVYFPVVLFNYFVDPANIFHVGIEEYAANVLTNGQIIESPGDMDEGLFQKNRIQDMKKTPETVIIGSSHVAYCPWEFEDFYIASMSGAYLGDYYALIGLLEDNKKLPGQIVFGVDPWAFMTGYSEGRHRSIAEYAEKTHNNVKLAVRGGYGNRIS